MPILEVKSINKKFGNKHVLKNVSFEVNPGEVVGFLGPNGAGKTTAIKMILGLLSIDSGDVHINGFDVKTDCEKALEKVGGIIESPEMYIYLTGMTNLKLFSRMYNGITQEQIDKAVRVVKLENRINDKVKKYSLGMRQRLGVAQAILHNPNLLILDEPTNGLDPVGIKELRDNLREYAKNGVGVLVSSHLLAEMELMCDRVVIIENGKVTTTMSMDAIGEVSSEQLLHYYFETDKYEAAAELLKNKEIVFELKDNYISLNANKQTASELAEMFIQNGIALYSMLYDQKTLEQAFLEATHAESIQ